MKTLKFFSLSPNESPFYCECNKTPGLFDKINICINIGKT